MEVLKIALIAGLAEGLGVATGIILLYLFNIKNQRLIGMLFGATSGLMIAIICFDVLPEALHANRNILVVLGVGIGLCLGILLGDFTDVMEHRFKTFDNKLLGTGVILLMGIAIHNIPEGFAFGTLAISSPETMYKFALVMCLHSIPEAIAVAIPMKASKTKTSFLIAIPIALGSIMGIGAFLGFVLSQVLKSFITTALGTAAGIILFIVCNELLPESRKIWNGRMTTVATVIGLLLGMFLVI